MRVGPMNFHSLRDIHPGGVIGAVAFLLILLVFWQAVMFLVLGAFMFVGFAGLCLAGYWAGSLAWDSAANLLHDRKRKKGRHHV